MNARRDAPTMREPRSAALHSLPTSFLEYFSSFTIFICPKTMTGSGLSSAFADVEVLAAVCRFKDCSHRTTGCAVRAALEQGELSEDRLLSYQKLRSENARSEACRTEKEKEFKQTARFNKTDPRK